jgi:cobalamin synthase
MLATYFYTVFMVFALIQIIYILLFYRLENKQKEGMETTLLHSTKGIYFTLFTLILSVPILTIIISAITGSLFLNPVSIGFYTYGLIIGISIFFLFNRSVIKLKILKKP